MSLTEKEKKRLIELMNKLEFPVALPIFEAWCKFFGIVCAEIVLTRDSVNGSELFLVYRDDKFFKGWHIPGCVHLPNEEFKDTLKRIFIKEIKMNATDPVFFGWFERSQGEGIGKSRRGYELSLVFSSKLIGESRENYFEKFFPVNNLPKDILEGHLPIINNVISSQ